MTRLELLTLAVGRARANGFEFRRWYTGRLGLPWITPEAALTLLEAQRRYYALLFSHEFAQTFWKPGTEITFDVPSRSFQRAMPDGSVRVVHRKGFVRRSSRPNAWRYHLRQMALAEEPLRYLRKYLHVECDSALDDGKTAPAPIQAAEKQRSKPVDPRPLPEDLPRFLQRPYRPASS